MRALALALVLLTLAGCLASPAPAPAATSADAMASRYAEPALVGPGGDTETSLTVGEDGTILACSHGGFTGRAPPVWASLDGGATFERLTIPDETFTGDCDVAVTSAGWFVAYTAVAKAASGTLLGLELRVATSHDQGKTWTIAQPIPGNKLQDRSWLTTSGDTIILSYLPARPNGFGCDQIARTCCIVDGAASWCSADSLAVAVSTDGGATWTPKTPVVAPGDGPEVFVNGHPIAWDGGKSIAVPLQTISTVDDANARLALATSADGGLSWTMRPIASAGDVGTFPSVARAGDGTLEYAYASGKQTDASVDVVTSRDGGASWSKPTVLAPHASFDINSTWGQDVFAAPAIAVAPSGEATVAWIETTNATGTPAWSLHVAHVAASGAVDADGVVATLNAAGQGAFEFLSARSAKDGRALVVYPWHAPGCQRSPPGVTSSRRNAECVMLLATRAPRTA